MRGVILLCLALAALLAGGCHRQPQPAGKRASVAEHSVAQVQHSIAQFQNIATAAQLGEPWLAAGGAASIAGIYPSADGSRVMLLLHGKGFTLLSLEPSKPEAARAYELDREPLAVDPGRLVVYALSNKEELKPPMVMSRSLMGERSEWQAVPGLANLADEIVAISKHPASNTVWILGYLHRAAQEPGGSESAVAVSPASENVDPILAYLDSSGNAHAFDLGGPGYPSALALEALANGSALVRCDYDLLLFDPAHTAGGLPWLYQFPGIGGLDYHFAVDS